MGVVADHGPSQQLRGGDPGSAVGSSGPRATSHPLMRSAWPPTAASQRPARRRPAALEESAVRLASGALAGSALLRHPPFVQNRRRRSEGARRGGAHTWPGLERPRSPPTAPGSASAPAHPVHSRYTRTLADLNAQGTSVRLQLAVRRFHCTNPSAHAQALARAFRPSPRPTRGRSRGC